MMRLIRLSFLLVAAFVAGMLVERAHQRDLCEKSGGQWLRAGICGEK
jgi:hypothetical protein